MERILYVEPTGDIGGAEVSLLSVVGRLKRYVPEVVVPWEGRLSARLRCMDVPVHILGTQKGLRRSPARWAWSVLRLAWLCRQRGASLMHANHEFANRRAALASRLARIPYVCHVRNIQTPQTFGECWLGLAEVLVANSKATERSYVAALRPAQKSQVIYNGLDLSFFDGKRNSSPGLGFGSGNIIVAQVGRIAPEKGIHIFVQAMAAVAQRHRHVCGAVVGDTSAYGSQPYEQELKRLASSLGLTDRFVFTGYIDDVRKVYRSIDLLVQPSAREPFGRSVLEAMAMKVPVVATAAGGVTEVVVDGVTGLLVPPGDVDALAKAVMRIVQEPSLGRKLGENGRVRAREFFSIEEHVARVEEVYDSLLKNKGARRAA